MLTAFLKNALLEVQEYLRLLGQVGRGEGDRYVGHVLHPVAGAGTAEGRGCPGSAGTRHPAYGEPSLVVMAIPKLGDYLRSRRAKVTPREVGLPDDGRRRVPGLRREEVASRK